MKKIYTLSMLVNNTKRKDLVKGYQPLLKIKRGRKKYLFWVSFIFEKVGNRKTKVNFLNISSLNIILNHLASLQGTFSLNSAYNEILEVKKNLSRDEERISKYLGWLKDSLFEILLEDGFVIEDKNVLEVETNNFELNLDEIKEKKETFTDEDVKEIRKNIGIEENLKTVTIYNLKKTVKAKGIPTINKNLKNYYVQILIKIESIEKAKWEKLSKEQKEKIAKNLVDFMNKFSKDKIEFE